MTGDGDGCARLAVCQVCVRLVEAPKTVVALAFDAQNSLILASGSPRVGLRAVDVQPLNLTNILLGNRNTGSDRHLPQVQPDPPETNPWAVAGYLDGDRVRF